jgi:hypothetical protein
MGSIKFNIERALKSSHRRIDGLLDDLLAAAGKEDVRPATLGAPLRGLSLQLMRHLRFEEKWFFPALRRSNKTRLARRLDTIASEHQWMCDRLSAALARFRAGDLGAVRVFLEELRAFMEGHEREEEITYAELTLTEAEQEKILAYLMRKSERR